VEIDTGVENLAIFKLIPGSRSISSNPFDGLRLGDEISMELTFVRPTVAANGFHQKGFGLSHYTQSKKTIINTFESIV
jgi:hypothetical protein